MAVSGGQDSLCMAQLLINARSKWGWQLAIAHCNHNWREDAAANAKHVQGLSEQWQISCYVKTATTGLPSEAAARTWRYGMLAEIALGLGFEIITTGHTLSDRAETLLYNLIRGSGADGLQALGWHRQLGDGLELVRPLLGISRRETGAYCEAIGLPIWLDSTNQDLSYRRNRLRAEVIPYLAEHFNPAVEESLAQTAELLRDDVCYLEAIAQQFWHKDRAEINRVVLKEQPIAIQRRVIHQFLGFFLPHQPSFDHVQNVMNLLDAPNRTCGSSLSQGWIAQVEHPCIRLIAPRR